MLYDDSNENVQTLNNCLLNKRCRDKNLSVRNQTPKLILFLCPTSYNYVIKVCPTCLRSLFFIGCIVSRIFSFRCFLLTKGRNGQIKQITITHIIFTLLSAQYLVVIIISNMKCNLLIIFRFFFWFRFHVGSTSIRIPVISVIIISIIIFFVSISGLDSTTCINHI